jgi:hypothetical protein
MVVSLSVSRLKSIQRAYGNERDESAPTNRETDIEVSNGGVLGGVSGTGVDIMNSTDLTSPDLVILNDLEAWPRDWHISDRASCDLRPPQTPLA